MTKLTAKRFADFMNDQIDAIKQNNSAKPDGAMYVLIDFALLVQTERYFEDRTMTKPRMMRCILIIASTAPTPAVSNYTEEGHDYYGQGTRMSKPKSSPI